ncbi:DNA-directed RNA polymerase [Achromobacter sp. DH1f]|uniref:DNA-directed RNA polymerase n=1 Tax=Achromobacter sp. DH1f TaxID=1397275 RepID=UPI0004682345|nr:DNA-directed RNA polymerase [Achromobacter sp. DH1f]
MTQLKGGYLSLRTRAVKSMEHGNAHTAAIARPMAGASLEALNWIQKTQWAINTDVLEVALHVRERGLDLAGFPAAENEQLPAPIPDAQWALFTDDERKAHMKVISAVHDKNAKLEGMRARTYRMLELAKDMAQFPRIWFPHYADFRGRFYPRPQDLHTQGDSLIKGLLTFAETQKAGVNGQFWLLVATANAFGEDKLPLEARADWAEDHMKWILRTAQDPMANLDFWADTDSPWEFLALCFEVARFADFVAKHGEAAMGEFDSRIPVRLDATCSGIQHLSAMMKDPLSAAAVNVLPTGKREDIYGEVARIVQQRIALDAANGNPIAVKWLGHVERKTVKRAVMTTPYGVTEPGILAQLISDGFCKHFENGKERYAAAGYLTEAIVSSLDANIGQPRAAMKFFQATARHLGEQNKPLVWTTPAGFTVRQAYYPSDMKRVSTLGGTVAMYRENTEAPMKLDKQANAAAPNVVHSYDAAHLALTCVEMKREGIRDLAFVHDSFGTHAGHIDTLNRHIREQFVGMYDGPALEQWRDNVATHTGCLDLPPVPRLGDDSEAILDVTAVLKSEFFFS